MSQEKEIDCKAQIIFNNSATPVDFQGGFDGLYKALENTCKNLYRTQGFPKEVFIKILNNHYDSPSLPGDMKDGIREIPPKINKNLSMRIDKDGDRLKVFSFKYNDPSEQDIQNQIQLNW
jgi:hypothetical protein